MPRGSSGPPDCNFQIRTYSISSKYRSASHATGPGLLTNRPIHVLLFKPTFMRVAVISAEAVPYSKTGGLADVAGALPKALKAVDVGSVLITPCYLQTKGEYLWSTAVDDLNVDWRGGVYPAKA